MPSLPESPVLKKPIPETVMNAGATLEAIDLNDYIQSPNPESGKVVFLAELSSGEPLPEDIVCTLEGVISGVPSSETVGNYTVIIIAENESGIPLTASWLLTIQPILEEGEAIKTNAWWSGLKSRVWDALGKSLPMPDISELYNRPITETEIYYLLQRFATLTIWDAYNLEMPNDKVLLKLKDMSPYYDAFDCGSCIIAAPKDLYSHERTLEDALQAARVIAREVYTRGWTIQLAGFEKMARSAWVELQRLGDLHGKPLEILHYIPSPEEIKIYNVKVGTVRP